MLAVGTMSPTIQAIFFGIAVVSFALSAFTTRVQLVALGLAAFAVPFFWAALAAS